MNAKKDNKDRAEKAFSMLLTRYQESGNVEEMITDALTDLIHLMDEYDITPINMFIRCQDHWMEEKAEEATVAEDDSIDQHLESESEREWEQETINQEEE
jgi:hypothetical protein